MQFVARAHALMLAFVHAHGFSPSTESPMLVRRPSGPAARSSAYAQQQRTAVVVGCGPAGLAAALVCARNHNFKVTVIEASSEAKITSYDRSKAYFYNINQRGQSLTRLFPGLQRGIAAAGIGMSRFERLTVPGDPEKLFNNVPFSRPQTAEEKKKFGKFYWIPRHTPS